MIWDSFGIRGGPIPKDQESGIGINLGLEVSQFLEHELIIWTHLGLELSQILKIRNHEFGLICEDNHELQVMLERFL